MALRAGEKVRLYLESPDGRVYDITGTVEHVSISVDHVMAFSELGGYHSHVRQPEVTAELTIRGDHMHMFSSDQMEDLVETQRDKQEWECSYCGHINPMSARYCGQTDDRVAGCNARRPFYF